MSDALAAMHKHTCALVATDLEHDFCRCECGATSPNTMGESDWSVEGTAAATTPTLSVSDNTVDIGQLQSFPFGIAQRFAGGAKNLNASAGRGAVLGVNAESRSEIAGLHEANHFAKNAELGGGESDDVAHYASQVGSTSSMRNNSDSRSTALREPAVDVASLPSGCDVFCDDGCDRPNCREKAELRLAENGNAWAVCTGNEYSPTAVETPGKTLRGAIDAAMRAPSESHPSTLTAT